MKNEVHQLEQKYRDIQQLKVLEEKITVLKKEIAWAQVNEKEKVPISFSLGLSQSSSSSLCFVCSDENIGVCV